MEVSKKFKLFLPGIAQNDNQKIKIIAADLRVVETKLRYLETENSQLVQKAEKSYKTCNFSGFEEMVKEFISSVGISGSFRISVAVPGPVMNGVSQPERLHWTLDSQKIKLAIGAEKVFLINDLEASAYGLANISDADLVEIHKTEIASVGNVAILAPGNGLGEAGLFCDGTFLRPFATEGGHCEFSPRTNDEVDFYQFLHRIYGIVSWETVLTDSGLFNIYRFLRDVKHLVEPNWLTQEIESGNFINAIIEGALEDRDRICTITIDTFLIFLAREANSLVLKLKATGGLILSGDMAVALQKLLNKDKFYKNFILSDKMEHILKDIPIYLLLNQNTIICGAANYGVYS